MTALRQVRANLPQDALVTVPEVLWFDDTANVIVMSDCGAQSITLKQALMANALPLALAHDIDAEGSHHRDRHVDVRLRDD